MLTIQGAKLMSNKHTPFLYRQTHSEVGAGIVFLSVIYDFRGQEEYLNGNFEETA